MFLLLISPEHSLMGVFMAAAIKQRIENQERIKWGISFQTHRKLATLENHWDQRECVHHSVAGSRSSISLVQEERLEPKLINRKVFYHRFILWRSEWWQFGWLGGNQGAELRVHPEPHPGWYRPEWLRAENMSDEWKAEPDYGDKSVDEEVKPWPSASL